MWLEVLAAKSEALECFKRFRAAAELESGCRLKAFRTDRGGEFNSGAFVVFCNDHGIKHNTTTPYTPQQNGVVERRNQTVVEMARCLLKSMGVPSKFWGEAVRTAVYILNRSPTKSLNGKTPYEAWFGRKPGVKHLKTFGCVAYAKTVGPGVSKLTDRAVSGVFLGYEPGTKGYRIYDPVKDKLLVTRDVVFDEKKQWNWEGKDSRVIGGATATEAPDIFQVQWDDTVAGPTTGLVEPKFSEPEPDAGDPGPPAVSASIPQSRGGSNSPPHTPNFNSIPRVLMTQWAAPPTGQSEDSEGAPLRYRTIPNLLDTTEEVQDFEYSGLCLVAAEEPRSVQEALTEQCWRQAMQAEMRAIEANCTWEVSVLPPKHKAIGLKWVFKVKKDPEGNVIKHKARLVAKGYAQ